MVMDHESRLKSPKSLQNAVIPWYPCNAKAKCATPSAICPDMCIPRNLKGHGKWISS